MKQLTVWFPEDLNPNTKELVAKFAEALAAKLHEAEKKYGYSDKWMMDNWEHECRQNFCHHLDKGDPRDVAAYCAFMWYHKWPTTLRKDPAAELGIVG